MNIFVDGSYSPQMKFGTGAYIIVSSEKMMELSKLTISELKIAVEPLIKYYVFKEAKGSTDVEQQCLLLALQAVNTTQPIVVYTDCQKAQTTKAYNVIHIEGHTKQVNRIGYEKIFDVIDKKVRKYLRKMVKQYI